MSSYELATARPTILFCFNSQLNKLKSGIKNGAEITLKLSSNDVSNDW